MPTGQHHFGWALADGYRSAQEAGFDTLAFRRGHDRVAIDIPGLAVASTTEP